jgi:hypothetical protein
MEGMKKIFYIGCWMASILVTSAPADLVSNAVKWYAALVHVPEGMKDGTEGTDIMLSFLIGMVIGGALRTFIVVNKDGSFSFVPLRLRRPTKQVKKRKRIKGR